MNNYNMNFIPNYYMDMLNIPTIDQNINSDNIQKDNKLSEKLKKQAGDNMNFNKCNYQQNTSSLYDAYDGFIRGNMFADLFNTYKINKPYDIKPSNEQAELLTYIDAYCFAAHDLNLYLDTHPNDTEAFNIFKKYIDDANNIISQYEQKYGPLLVGSSTYPWAWNNSPWPWENE